MQSHQLLVESYELVRFLNRSTSFRNDKDRAEEHEILCPYNSK